jgi:hypothetical protein
MSIPLVSIKKALPDLKTRLKLWLKLARSISEPPVRQGEQRLAKTAQF